MPDDPKPGELDDLESLLDRFLERKLFGVVGPRYRSIALIGALALGVYTATKKCPEPSAQIASSASSGERYLVVGSNGSSSRGYTTTEALRWNVPGLR